MIHTTEDWRHRASIQEGSPALASDLWNDEAVRMRKALDRISLRTSRGGGLRAPHVLILATPSAKENPPATCDLGAQIQQESSLLAQTLCNAN